MTTTRTSARAGWLGLQGWEGLTWREVLVVDETPKRYRIEALVWTKLAGRWRALQVGERALVPKGALRFERPTSGTILPPDRHATGNKAYRLQP